MNVHANRKCGRVPSLCNNNNNNNDDDDDNELSPSMIITAAIRILNIGLSVLNER